MRFLKLRLLCAGVALCCAVGTVSAALLFPASASAAVSAPAQIPAATASETEPPYLLRDCDGTVCIYSGGTLLRSTGIATASLPQADRSELAQGISVYSESELAARLEDFGS